MFKDDKFVMEDWEKVVFPGKGDKICKSTDVKKTCRAWKVSIIHCCCIWNSESEVASKSWKT